MTIGVQTKGEFNGDVWLGFERLTCVPIQTRMVKETMLTKEEKQWLKVSAHYFFLSVGSSNVPRYHRITIRSAWRDLSHYSRMTNVLLSG
jgi:hypothetical protein